MFDSGERLAGEIEDLLRVLRGMSGGRYACLLDPQRVLFESSEDGPKTPALRRFLSERTAALFRLPERLAGAEEGPGEDVFAGWEGPDGFFLAFLNRRVTALVACDEPEALQAQALQPLRALADRVFRWNPSYRSDGGRFSLFFNRPRLDLVVVGRPDA